MSHITNQQLLMLKKTLHDELQHLEKRLRASEAFGLTDSLRENTGELSAYDNHPADLGSETFERGKDVALLESAEEQQREIRTALQAIELGEYGHCRVCGEPIPFERLQAIPTTLYCKTHSPSQHTSARRPIEEKSITPQFHHIGLNENKAIAAFDGEDAWQIVESWGTSNTPAMADDRDVLSYDEMAIEADENDGYVESFESFLATDIYGNDLAVIRNKRYREYIEKGEGKPLLEVDQEQFD